MSAEDLALFLRKKMGEQRTTNTEMVRRTGISRRTWYRLLNSDIEEAKLSTLIKLANALNVSVTQIVQIYFSRGSFSSKVTKGHSVETNLPSNSLVGANSSFIKTWDVKNQTKEHWQGLALRCVDESLDIQVIDRTDKTKIPAHTLKPEDKEISVPDTKIGSIASISVNFVAPQQAGATVSHWRFFKNGEPLDSDSFPPLNCLVMVVDSVSTIEKT